MNFFILRKGTDAYDFTKKKIVYLIPFHKTEFSNSFCQRFFDSPFTQGRENLNTSFESPKPRHLKGHANWNYCDSESHFANFTEKGILFDRTSKNPFRIKLYNQGLNVGYSWLC